MTTDIILLERVENLGQMGEIVKVRPGFARNYLLPQKKALRATKDNIAYFDTQRKTLEAMNEKKKSRAEDLAKTVQDQNIRLIRQAGESGQLYGSVTARDIADAFADNGIKLERRQVELNDNLKSIGLYDITIALHPEVKVDIPVNIARSEAEADVQEKTGKAVIADDDQASTAEAAEQMLADALEDAEEASEEIREEFLEEEALEAEAEAKAEEKAQAESEAENDTAETGASEEKADKSA